MHLFSKTDQKWGGDNDPKMKEEKEKAAVFHTQISKSSSTSKKKKKNIATESKWKFGSVCQSKIKDQMNYWTSFNSTSFSIVNTE